MPIMIVEDNLVSAKLVEGLLQKAGHQTVTAKNGKEALELLPTICNVQIILTDYLMPEMNGLEFIQHLKMLPELKDIPVIILSANCNLPTVKALRGLDCGMLLVKPVKKEQLLERVEQVLRTLPAVVRPKFDILESLQIGDQEYQELVDMLADQVDAVIPAALQEDPTSNEPLSKPVGQLLSDLVESASLLGADKFCGVYAKLTTDKALTGFQLPALLRALQELALELTTRRSPKKTIHPSEAPPPKEASAA